MIPLFTEKKLEKAKSKTKLKLQCICCKEAFRRSKKDIQSYINPNSKNKGDFCSIKCQRNFQTPPIYVVCSQCKESFKKQLSDIKKSKKHFCSRSCNAMYYNTHKKHGTKRSKLEVYLEEVLVSLYPGIEIHFNRKDAIMSELDIYIPSLNLAFELNGIFHYEPIFGDKKLTQTQSNDNRKFQACLENNIELCIIDSSQQKYFKEKTSKKYLDIITSIIDMKGIGTGG